MAEVITYIAADRPSAAEAIATKIEENIRLLSDNAHLGQIPKEEELARLGYRYLVVENYLIFYIIERQTIYIHRILHGARDYLSLL
ncbi:MAG: type II toxin-antitoxin system RelE/ParE family toxin [Bacteroidetes bacterium]|nr:type II toxin-antitoxin system RelE/ParE family toxin [Bacteroidota bacterium]